MCSQIFNKVIGRPLQCFSHWILILLSYILHKHRGLRMVKLAKGFLRLVLDPKEENNPFEKLRALAKVWTNGLLWSPVQYWDVSFLHYTRAWGCLVLNLISPALRRRLQHFCSRRDRNPSSSKMVIAEIPTHKPSWPPEKKTLRFKVRKMLFTIIQNI